MKIILNELFDGKNDLKAEGFQIDRDKLGYVEEYSFYVSPKGEGNTVSVSFTVVDESFLDITFENSGYHDLSDRFMVNNNGLKFLSNLLDIIVNELKSFIKNVEKHEKNIFQYVTFSAVKYKSNPERSGDLGEQQRLKIYEYFLKRNFPSLNILKEKGNFKIKYSDILKQL